MTRSLLRRVAGAVALAVGLSIAVAAPASASAAHVTHTAHHSQMKPADWWWGS